MPELTSAQLLGIETATRASSILSLLASLFIITTYLSLPPFRRPTTRLIFYATWGNMATTIATLISVSALPSDARETSPLCQLQALLIQWFMLADPVWVFCMAVSVGRIFKARRFDARKVPKYEIGYCLGAYGVPGVVAAVYLVHDQISSRRIVGSAILWCWVRSEYDWMRVAFFYAPMWLLAIATMGIHIWVGTQIYKVKMKMRQAVKDSRQRFAQMSAGMLEDPFVDPNDKITITTNISHDTHDNDSWSRSATPLNDVNWPASCPSPRSPPPRFMRASETTRSSTPCSPTTPDRHGLLVPLNPNSPRRHQNPLLIGKYRATAYAAPLASGDFATLPWPRVPVFRPSEHAAHVKRRKETEEAFRYFKAALLLFVALVVVWVPSSVNRLYQVAHPDHPSYALNLISALVLPTQGFWNAVIYAQASWKECKRVYGELRWIVLKQSPGGSGRDDSLRYKGSVASEGTEFSVMDRSEPNSSKLTV